MHSHCKKPRFLKDTQIYTEKVRFPETPSCREGFLRLLAMIGTREAFDCLCRRRMKDLFSPRRLAFPFSQSSICRRNPRIEPTLLVCLFHEHTRSGSIASYTTPPLRGVVQCRVFFIPTRAGLLTEGEAVCCPKLTGEIGKEGRTGLIGILPWHQF